MSGRTERWASRRRRGFSFIELLAVIALIGLLLGFVVLRVDGLIPGSRLAAGARQIGSNAGLARGEAVASGQVYAVRYDVGRSRYMILTPPHPEDVDSGLYKVDDLVPTVWETLPDGVRMADVQVGTRTRTDGTVQVLFTAIGTCTPHAIHLHLKAEEEGGQEARWMTVIVNPLTGLVDLIPKKQTLDLFADDGDFGGGLSGDGF